MSNNIKSKILHVSARLFLEKGYTDTTMREISEEACVNISKVMYTMGSKEEILCALVKYVLEGQFKATADFIRGVTEDKILFYAAETTLQLYMAESREHIRNLYSAAYSLPNSSAIIYNVITHKLEDIFREHLPELDTKDFYELEIASGGIMRGYISTPCDMYFTMERKVRRFLETTLRVYCVPQEKIDEAISFVSQFDYPTIAQGVIDNLLELLEKNIGSGDVNGKYNRK